MALCLLILDECGVACTPGLDFDPLRGGKYIRFSFSGETSVFALQAHCTAFFFFMEFLFVLIKGKIDTLCRPGSTDDMKEACQRLEQWYNNKKK